jgi:hypothetical protein
MGTFETDDARLIKTDEKLVITDDPFALWICEMESINEKTTEISRYS